MKSKNAPVVVQPAHKAPQLKEISVSQVDNAPHNPKSRILGESVRWLARTIAEVGLKYPILVRPKGHRFEISDGHRRLAAYKKLGWATIPAFVLGAEEDYNKVYSRINATQARFTGNQLLEVFLHNPAACTEGAQRKFNHAEHVLGRPRVEKICKMGMSLNVLRIARLMAEYVGRPEDDNEFIGRAVDWLLEYKLVYLVRGLMVTEANPGIIERAVRKMKPIRMKPSVPVTA